MSFVRQRPPGDWLTNSTVDPAEFEYIDESLSNALDALYGGTYALAGDVVIGSAPGVTWTFDLPLTCNDGLTVYDGITSFDALTVLADSYLTNVSVEELRVYRDALFFDDTRIGGSSGNLMIVEAQAVFNSWATFNDNTSFLGQTAVSGNFYVYGPATFDDDVDFNDPIDFNDAVRFNNGGVTITTGLTLAGGPVGFGNDGRIPKRQTTGADANTSYSPSYYDQVHVAPGGLTGDREYQIDDSGAVNGDRIRFTNEDVTHQVSVKTGATVLAILKAVSTTAHYWCDVQRINGVWRRVASGVLP